MTATKIIIADLNQRDKLNEKNYNAWHRKIPGRASNARNYNTTNG